MIKSTALPMAYNAARIAVRKYDPHSLIHADAGHRLVVGEWVADLFSPR